MSDINEAPKDAKAQAKADKAYKKASRPWFKKKRFWLLGILVLGGISSAVSGGGGDSSSTGGSSKVVAESPAAEAEAPAVEVTAAKLLSDLEANALAAKTDWDGKKVTITGKLDNIDASGDYFSLTGDSEFSFINVQVYIDDNLVPTVSAFTKGQSVTVTGEISDVGEVLGYSVKAISIP